MTTGRVAAALTALCLLCQPAFGFIKVFPEFDDEPGAATFFWAAVTTVGPFIGSTVSAQESSADEGDKLVRRGTTPPASSPATVRSVARTSRQPCRSCARPRNTPGTATCNWPRRSSRGSPDRPYIRNYPHVSRRYPAKAA